METEITIPLTGFHSSEVAGLRRQLDTKLRNVEIRLRYAELRKGGMDAGDAIEELRREYSLSEGAISRAIWPR